jgi:dihydroxyacetone kinase-like protein
MAQKQSIDGVQWVMIIQAMANAIQRQSEHLSALDSTVGDGDHGVNMSAAMAVAAKMTGQLESPTPSSVLKVTGTTVMNEMGGASGVIFGAFFRGGGRAVKGKETMALEDVAAMLAAGLAEVQKRGKAQPGDKTMVDALAPALKAVREAEVAKLGLGEALARAAEQAGLGAEATRAMTARFGRAKALGERSIGYQDAGATSMAIMLAAWAETVAEDQ